MNVFDYIGNAKRYLPLLGFLFGGVAYGQSTYVTQNSWNVQANISAGNLDSYGNFQKYIMAGNTGADQFTGLNSVLVGGNPIADVTGELVPSGELGTPAKMSIYGAPDGTYNAGCALCIILGNANWFNNRAGISGGGDYRNGASDITAFSDGVGEYLWTGNISPLLQLNVDHYDSTHVYLKTPLTPSQMALLHTNMYIATNSVYIPSSSSFSAIAPIPANGGTYQEDYYKGVISGWDTTDGTYITVSAWAAPASGDTSSNQIPSPSSSGGTSSLDTTFTNTGTPTVFVGSVTGMSARNDYINYDQRSTSLVRSIQANEIDNRYYVKTPHSYSLQGLVFSDQALSGSPVAGINAYTSDSKVININSDRPTIFSIGMDGSAVLFNSPSLFINGNGGVSTSSNITLDTLFSHSAYVDGTNAMNLIGYLKKDSSTIGAAGSSFHLGVQVDGSVTSPETTGGSWGQIVWDVNAANQGGISLCGGSSASSCAINVNYNNAISFKGNSSVTLLGDWLTFADTYGNVGGWIQTTKGTDTTGSTPTNAIDIYFPNSGGILNILGNVTGYMYQETPTSPADNATCSAGQFTDDANYHYVCVSANTWKRVALSTY